VQVALGHHSAGFTLATYVHLLPDDLPEPPEVVTKEATRAAESGRDAAAAEKPKTGIVPEKPRQPEAVAASS
jgi:hypothetical protein